MSYLGNNLTPQRLLTADSSKAEQDTQEASFQANSAFLPTMLRVKEFLDVLDNSTLLSLRCVSKFSADEYPAFYHCFSEKFTFRLEPSSVQFLSEAENPPSRFFEAYRSFKIEEVSCTAETFRLLAERGGQVERLDLSQSDLSEVIESLSDDVLEKVFGNCEILNLEGTEITSTALQRILVHLKKLKSIGLGECEEVSAAIEAMPNDVLARAFDNCELVDLYGADITSSALKKLLLNAKSITKLSLDGNFEACEAFESLSDEELRQIFMKLVVLDLTIIRLTDGALRKILPHLKHVKELYLNQDDTDISFFNHLSGDEIKEGFGHLEKLELQAGYLTSSTLQKLLKSFEAIKDLNLFQAEELSDAIEQLSDDELEKAFKHCEKLDISFSGITASAFKKLWPHLRQIKELTVHQCPEVGEFIDTLSDDQLNQFFQDCKKVNLSKRPHSTAEDANREDRLFRVASVSSFKEKHQPGVVLSLS